jgi:acetyl esterase/lipase
MIAVSIDYRLSQEAIFPAQLHDSKSAVRYLRSHASELNIDPRRIGAWGASAGGHLASLLAVTTAHTPLEGDRGWPGVSSAIQAACSWFGPADLNLMDQFPKGITPASPGMDAESAEGRLVGGPVHLRQELVSLANPIRYLGPECPPLLLMHGAKDNIVPLVSSERFHQALIARGVEAHLHVIPNGHHNAYLWGDHHTRMVTEFFEWHLRDQPGSRRSESGGIQ